MSATLRATGRIGSDDVLLVLLASHGDPAVVTANLAGPLVVAPDGATRQLDPRGPVLRAPGARRAPGPGVERTRLAMLVLTRRPGQSIIVGDSIELVVVRIEGDRVVLGIDAPRDVRVVRAELLRAVEAENQVSSAARDRLRALIARADEPV